MTGVGGFAKREIALRYWLHGRDYFMALEAMDWAGQYHTGFRKDGVTPEFDHQISIAHFVRTLPNLMHMEDTITVVMLHDIREDHGVSHEEVLERTNPRVAAAVDAMTKTFRGVKRPEELVFQQIANDPLASVAKGADRIHNLNSMVGVFSPQKQVSYLEESDRLFMPMLKVARRRFPRQEPAYENIKHSLNSQMALIRAIHESGSTKQ